MAKLYFWINPTGKNPMKEAEGDGDVPKNPGEFTVEITDGTVIKGKVYDVRRGTSSNGDMCNCKTGASKNATATFLKP